MSGDGLLADLVAEHTKSLLGLLFAGREAPDGSCDAWRLDSAGNSVCSEDAEATVGLVVWPDAAGRLAITGFIEGSDAQRSGLKSGDVIASVDGHSILGLPADEASHLLSGDRNSTVHVSVERGSVPQRARHSVVLVRDQVHTASSAAPLSPHLSCPRAVARGNCRTTPRRARRD